jgi:NAD(P)H-dependent flavin oxidoreductase YrpB (nitropropane dioxygenase family)
MGTRFLVSAEYNAHDVYKRKVLEAREEDTVRTTLFGNGWPNAWHRTLCTDFIRQWLPQEQRGSEQRSDERTIGEITLGGMRMPLPRFGGIPPARDATGELESMDFLAGQSVGLVHAIKPAADIVREVVQDAATILRNAARLSH